MRRRLLSFLLLLLALGSTREAAAQACLSTQGSQEYCKALTSGVRFGFPRYATAALPTCNTNNKGAAAFNTTTGTVQVCSGSAWGDVGPAGSGITSLNGLVAGTQLFAAPAAGLTITSVTDTHTFALANDLAALEGLSGTGMAARTGTSTWTTRTITGTSNEIAVTNGDGVSGAPTLALASTVNLSSKTLRVPNSTTLPATCTVGDSYMDTDATSGARWYLCESTNTWAVQGTGGGGGAPTDATYITQTANGSLSAAQALGALATGCLGSATTTGVVSARTITGTSNEVSVSKGDCSGNPTLSLPATINLGGKTSLQIPNAAAPTTSTFGEIAGDNNAWAASRGAVQFYDGTANTYLVGALASDTPSNGQVPTWNTGGTITWETPGAGSFTAPQIDVYTSTGANTWTKPAGCLWLEVFLWGAGGGGGSGRVGAAATQRLGGDGGGGGGYTWAWMPCASAGATETATVGAGGAGASGQTVDASNGITGTAGGASTFGSHARAGGGAGGLGGVNSTASTAVVTVGGGGTTPGGLGGGSRTDTASLGGFPSAATSTYFAVTGTTASTVPGGRGGPGGGAGGGINTSNVARDGTGGAGSFSACPTTVAGGAGGAASGTNGTNGTSQGGTTYLYWCGGSAGGGGGGHHTGTSGSGGNGGTPGAGGGGSGAATDGNDSAAGGTGGNGLIVVISHFQ